MWYKMESQLKSSKCRVICLKTQALKSKRLYILIKPSTVCPKGDLKFGIVKWWKHQKKKPIEGEIKPNRTAYETK